MNDQLLSDYDRIMEDCFRLFRDKNSDYGPTWLLYRDQSLNDEIWRKAKRIRTLEEHEDTACIPEGRDVEYVGIINYCVMFLIKLGGFPGIPADTDLTEDLVLLDSVDPGMIFNAYREIVETVRQLLIRKNTDYGDAWKSMSLGAMTDQIIIRVYRIRRILANHGRTRVSEGVVSQLYDIMNYCVFALIKMAPETEKKPSGGFRPGDVVKVLDGPLKDQIGVVDGPEPESSLIRVTVSIFGREAPIALEPDQLMRADN